MIKNRKFKIFMAILPIFALLVTMFWPDIWFIIKEAFSKNKNQTEQLIEINSSMSEITELYRNDFFHVLNEIDDLKYEKNNLDYAVKNMNEYKNNTALHLGMKTYLDALKIFDSHYKNSSGNEYIISNKEFRNFLNEIGYNSLSKEHNQLQRNLKENSMYSEFYNSFVFGDSMVTSRLVDNVIDLFERDIDQLDALIDEGKRKMNYFELDDIKDPSGNKTGLHGIYVNVKDIKEYEKSIEEAKNNLNKKEDILGKKLSDLKKDILKKCKACRERVENYVEENNLNRTEINTKSVELIVENVEGVEFEVLLEE